MNERIKELANKAVGKRSCYMIEAEYIKFAELIVKECLDISHRESHLSNTVLFNERSDKFIKDIHNRVDRATRKHFGVTE